MDARQTLNRAAAAFLSVTLCSCSTLPRSGPTHESILSQASVTSSVPARRQGVDYALVNLTKDVVPLFEETVLTSFAKGFGSRKSYAPNLMLGVGDTVQVSIFEAQSGGLFIPDDAGSRPGNYVNLPNQTVDAGGMIRVPYAGAVKVAGRRASEVEVDIEKKLANRAIEPQVVVTTVTSRANMVSILGDVNEPAQLDLNPAGERVLDLVARAGGIAAPGYETYVSIERGNKRATVLFQSLVDDPKENIYIRPGDTVYVNRERRTYLAFGASGVNGRIDFEDSNLTLGEALAKAGGLLDDRADPSQVFLYREVDRDVLANAGVDVSKIAGDQVPTVFHANMRDPAIFFAAQKFRMQDKDVIYVSNAGTVELAKFLSLVNGVSDTTANVPANAVTTRKSVNKLTN